MEQQSGKRRRPPLSCIQCRRRKIKCDRTNPYANCTSAKTQCLYKVYNDRSILCDQSGQVLDSTSAPHIAASPLSIVQQVISARTTAGQTGDNSRSRTVTEPSIQHNVTRQLDCDRNQETNLRDLLRRVEQLEQTSNSDHHCWPSGKNQDVLTSQSGMYDAQSSMNKTRIIRWSHWAGMAHEFENILTCFTQVSENEKNSRSQSVELGTLSFLTSELLRKCKDVARNLKATRPSRNLSRLDFDLELPSREVADMMMDIYFQSFESAHRILHIPSFRTEYRRCWEHPQEITTATRLRILLVIGIDSSLSDHGQTDTSLRNRVHQWVYAAQAWLSGPLEKDRLELGGIQIHCLTLVARQVLSIGGDLIWMSTGSLIHSAMQVSLHRSAKNLPAMSLFQSELRKRLWATILEMILQSSLDSAMPPRISLAEFDVEAPSNINDDDIDQSTTEVHDANRDTYTTTSMQLILLDSLPTRLRVLQLLNGLQSEISYLDALSLSSDIADACRKCDQFLRNTAASGVTLFHQNLLNYHIRRFLIPLHCPFVSKARENPLFYYSLKVSLDTALAIVSTEQDKDFLRLMAIGGGSFKEGFRNACTVISSELLTQVQTRYLDGTLRYYSEYRNLLKQAVNHLITLSTERIQQGETNVKSHLFLSMVMAEVKATETNAPIQTKIAQSALDSLEFCHSLLRMRAVNASLQDAENDMPTNFVGAQEDYDYDYDLDSFLLNEPFP